MPDLSRERKRREAGNGSLTLAGQIQRFTTFRGAGSCPPRLLLLAIS